MELYLPPKPRKKFKINWSDKMIEILKAKFAITFNRELAKELNISMRSLIRKARELKLEKEPGFLEKNRETITRMAVANNHNKYTGVKGWSVPNSENTRFKPGQTSLMKTDRELVSRVHKTRNETIKRERIRMRLGLSRLTNLKLK
jgi:hypothetical protein